MKLRDVFDALLLVTARLERLAGLSVAHSRPDAEGLGYARFPKFWSDAPVRKAIIAAHREMTIDELRAQLAAEFGPTRVPPRSSIHRLWQRIDQRAAKERRP